MPDGINQLTVYSCFIYTNRVFYQCPSGVRLMQDRELGSASVRFPLSVLVHKFLACFYEFQLIQCCRHRKNRVELKVAGDLVFGVWYTRPNKSKTFPRIFLSPSPLWPSGRLAPSTSARLLLESGHLCLLCRLQNKRLSKGKKGIKKKVVDPFSRKG